MATISAGTVAELAAIVVLVVVVWRSIRRVVGFDTHGSLGQWVAALAVGAALAGWMVLAAPDRFWVAADMTPRPDAGTPLRSGAGMLAGFVFMGGAALLMLFDRELGQYRLYRFVRVFGRGFVIGIVILVGIRVYLAFEGTTVTGW